MNIKKILPISLLATGLVMAKSPVETYGALSIKNNKLVDSAGSPVTLRGMSLFWHMDNGGKQFWNSSVVKYAQVNWHNSVIRAPVGVADGATGNKGYLSAPADAMMKIHTVVDAAIEAGSYVVVDWHAHQEARAGAVTFFTDLAKEYGNTPNIIWEIWNEPAKGGNMSESYINEVAGAIRKYSNNVIVIGSNEYSQTPQATYGGVDSKFKNLAYSIHFYSDHSFWGNIATANSAGHAVFATEWGMSSSSGDAGFNPISGSGNISTWIQTMNSAGVSHCNWSLGNPTSTGKTDDPTSTPEVSAAIKCGVLTNPSLTGDGWTDANLTASGKEIKAYLVAKNPAWTLSDTSTMLTSPLKIVSTKTTGFTTMDSVAFSASFNKAVPWTLLLTGRTSGTKKSVPSATSATVSGWVYAGSRNAGQTATWQSGETVDAVLNPTNTKVSYVLGTMTGIQPLRTLHETALRQVGTRLSVPSDLLKANSSVTVQLRNAQGQILWRKSGTVGWAGWVELGEQIPHFGGVQFLEVQGDEAIVRSGWAPAL